MAVYEDKDRNKMPEHRKKMEMDKDKEKKIQTPI